MLLITRWIRRFGYYQCNNDLSYTARVLIGLGICALTALPYSWRKSSQPHLKFSGPLPRPYRRNLHETTSYHTCAEPGVSAESAATRTVSPASTRRMGDSAPWSPFVSTKERISCWIPRRVYHAAGTSQDLQSRSAGSEYSLITPPSSVLTCTPSIPLVSRTRQVISRPQQGRRPR